MKFLYISERVSLSAIAWARQLTQQMGKQFMELHPQNELPASPEQMEEYCAEHDVDLIFVCTAAAAKSVQRHLDRFRTLRLPYVFIPADWQGPADTALEHVVAPVTMLEEEIHKAEILTHLMRYTGTQVTLLQAKDYGSKAAQNTGKIKTALSRFELNADIMMGKRDSMRLYRTLHEYTCSMLVLTASRDYGLDDIIFGPQERYVILHSAQPVLLLNPRGDLFSLCD